MLGFLTIIGKKMIVLISASSIFDEKAYLVILHE